MKHSKVIKSTNYKILNPDAENGFLLTTLRSDPPQIQCLLSTSMNFN